MTIEETLLHRYGPLLSVNQLASVLDRSPEGLRISLRTARVVGKDQYHSTEDWPTRVFPHVPACPVAGR